MSSSNSESNYSTQFTTCALNTPTTGGIHYENCIDRAGADLHNRFCIVRSEREWIFQEQRHLRISALPQQSERNCDRQLLLQGQLKPLHWKQRIQSLSQRYDLSVFQWHAVIERPVWSFLQPVVIDRETRAHNAHLGLAIARAFKRGNGGAIAKT